MQQPEEEEEEPKSNSPKVCNEFARLRSARLRTMRKQSWSAWLTFQRKNWPLLMVTLLSLSTAVVLIAKSSVTCSCDHTSNGNSVSGEVPLVRESVPSRSDSRGCSLCPLDFMKSKLVLLVSHELSLSGGPLLLMELAFLLRGVGAEVAWVTNQKPA